MPCSPSSPDVTPKGSSKSGVVRRVLGRLKRDDGSPFIVKIEHSGSCWTVPDDEGLTCTLALLRELDELAERRPSSIHGACGRTVTRRPL